MTDAPQRQGFAYSNRASRQKKAEKIAAIIEPRKALKGQRLLDIGTGAGYISAALAERGADVTVTDTENNLAPDVDLPFHQAEGTTLDFDDSSFDIILYNHVIEHVGTRSEQLAHLKEIRRVLKPDGLLYLSVPNRFAPVEPHYKLPLLSWLPLKLSSAYVRAAGKGDWYDCMPFAPGELRRMMILADFAVEDVTMEVLDHFLDHEATGVATKVPRELFGLARPVMPTLVMLGRPA